MLTIKTSERRLDVFLLSLLLNLNYFTPFSSVFIVNFEKVNAGGVNGSKNSILSIDPDPLTASVYRKIIHASAAGLFKYV